MAVRNRRPRWGRRTAAKRSGGRLGVARRAASALPVRRGLGRLRKCAASTGECGRDRHLTARFGSRDDVADDVSDLEKAGRELIRDLAGCAVPARPRPPAPPVHSLRPRLCSWPSNWGGTGGLSDTARSCSSSPSAGSGSVRPPHCAGPTSCPAAGCASSARSGASAGGGWSANPKPVPGTGP
jgi:hypothetical protein